MIQLTALTLLIYLLLEVFHFSLAYLAGTIFILFRLLPFITEINNHRLEISENISGLINIYNLNLREDKPYIKSGAFKISSFNDSIEFKDVSFSYQRGKQVLNDVSFKVKKGETIGIIGSSGAGKSTLLFLIPRLYDVYRGKIIVDGVDIKNLDIISWRKNIGIITQETFIFNDTIRRNLLLVRPDVSENELQRVLKFSHLKEFIAELPEGLDTLVGDRGIKLSGGQKQRLAIARVFLRNPKILIMDEATSSLDTVSERFIQQSINELRKDRTVVIVAHRLSTIKNVDRIIVLEKGCIVEKTSAKDSLNIVVI